MKVLAKWVGIILVATVLVLLIFEHSRFWILPRSTTESITGFELPDNAKFVEHVGGSNNLYYRRKIPYSNLENLPLPSDRVKLFDLPTEWAPYDDRFFGSLTSDNVATDAETLYYRTTFWDVALIRSRSEGTLIVGGIYTN